MAIHDFRSQRLFVDEPLQENVAIEASREQANYLLNVLRLGEDAQILLFNGRDGEWISCIKVEGRKKCRLVPRKINREQPTPPQLTYCFAPLKQARLDYMIQKAVEMGAGSLQPVITQYTQVRTINEKRVRANVIEAAEQCGILCLPEIRPAIELAKLPSELSPETCLIFCDEAANDAQELRQIDKGMSTPLALLIGPEGGFSDDERAFVRSINNVHLLGLGPRILRADTAAVAALAIIQSQIGDWYGGEQS